MTKPKTNLFLILFISYLLRRDCWGTILPNIVTRNYSTGIPFPTFLSQVAGYLKCPVVQTQTGMEIPREALKVVPVAWLGAGRQVDELRVQGVPSHCHPLSPRGGPLVVSAVNMKLISLRLSDHGKALCLF